ncbi:hypothetical protein VNO77_07788 [Canavalia gladiata]|uniref:Uncharacterized protein n=1 Tax=Canavalia gladiata TaxID=3824 RepID=A0AAN9M7X7_CANGL
MAQQKGGERKWYKRKGIENLRGGRILITEKGISLGWGNISSQNSLKVAQSSSSLRESLLEVQTLAIGDCCSGSLFLVMCMSWPLHPVCHVSLMVNRKASERKSHQVRPRTYRLTMVQGEMNARMYGFTLMTQLPWEALPLADYPGASAAPRALGMVELRPGS